MSSGTTINTSNAIFSSFVLIKKKPKARLSLSSLGLSSKYKRRLMSLKPGPVLLIYDLTNPKEPRLAQNIVLNNSCELKQSSDKGEEQCLVLQYQNEKNHTEEFTFYPENTENTKSDDRQSISKRLSRSFSTTSTNADSVADAGGEDQATCDDVDFESARKSVRLSIGAVTIMNRWRQVLTCSIADTRMVDDLSTSQASTPSLATLLQKKTLTLEEAEIIKQHMKMERPFTDNDPIQFNAKPDGAGGGVDSMLDECGKLEAVISKEIQQQEGQQQEKEKEKEEEKKPPPPPRRSSSNIDEKMKIFERKSSGSIPPSPTKTAPSVPAQRTSIKDRIKGFENMGKDTNNAPAAPTPPPLVSSVSSPTTEITKMLGSKTISDADGKQASKLMRQVSGKDDNEGEGRRSSIPIRQAQDNMFRESEIGEELLEQTLEAELDQVIVGTSTTLPAEAIRSKNDQEKRKPPPPPRRNSNAEFDFEKTEDWQVGLTEGEKVRVLTKMPDGWTKVRKESGEEGMVPTDYLIGSKN